MLYHHDRHTRLNPIPRDMELGLTAHFCEGDLRSPVSSGDVQRWLFELRASERWLACDCVNDSDDANPLLSPRQIAPDHLVLVRHGKVPHAAACPYHRLRPLSSLLSSSNSADASSSRPVPTPSAGILELLRAGRHAEALTIVLRAAGFDRWEATDNPRSPLSKGSRYKQLDNAGDLSADGDWRLSDVMCGHPNGFGWLGKRLQQQGTEGVMVGMVHSFEKGELVFRPPQGSTKDFLRTKVEGKVTSHFDRKGPVQTASGPAWVIAHLEASPSSGCRILSAHLHQVARGNSLLPIDNALEAKVADLLMSQIIYWARDRNIHVVLRKPLATPAEPWPADFVLEIPNGRRIVVEAYETNSADYRRMREQLLGQVIEPTQQPMIAIHDFGQEDTMPERRRLTAVLHAMLEEEGGRSESGVAGDGDAVATVP